MLSRFIFTTLALFISGYSIGQNFIVSNTDKTKQIEVRISWGGLQMQNALVERQTLDRISRPNVLSNPLINLTELVIQNNYSLTIANGSSNYHLIPMDPNKDVYELESGDRVVFKCTCGDSSQDNNMYCTVKTESSTYGRPATYCKSENCNSGCQSSIRVFSSSDKLNFESNTGGILIKAERVRSAPGIR